MSENRLHRNLNTLAVFSIASGSMISSGLFILPALAFEKAGPAMIVSYFIAALMVIPSMFTKAELATAMPRSGGTYFFVYRSLGPLLGTFAGLANWFSLSLKSAFALVGIGIFISILWPGAGPAHVKAVAVVFTLIFTFLNIRGTKESGNFQIILVFILMAILVYYIFTGTMNLEISHFIPFNTGGNMTVLGTSGMIFISFGGLTKIASIAQEVKDPGRVIPKGMFTSFIVVSLLYIGAAVATVGLVPAELLIVSKTPLSLGASMFSGKAGFWILGVAAMTAFITTANAGIMAASRTPLAMAQDNLLPGFLSRISLKRKTPVTSILSTAIFMIASILFLELEDLVKMASTMMLLLFTFNNIALIVMRSSRVSTYRPLFKTPLYPFLPIAGIISYIFLIADMGKGPILMTLTFFVASILWYFIYSRSRNANQSALFLLVERLLSREARSSELRDELKEILMERDDIVEDRFDRIIQETPILDMEGKASRKELFKVIATHFSKKFSQEEKLLISLLEKREEESTTVIHAGLAIPHIIIPGKKLSDILVIRAKKGINFGEDKEPVKLIFALAGTIDERNFHLQALMAIAQIVKNPDFLRKWDTLPGTEDLRALILLAERIRQGNI